MSKLWHINYLALVLAKTHDLFHIPIMRRYSANSNNILKYENMKLYFDLVFNEFLVRFGKRQVIELYKHSIPIVKMQ